VAKRWIKMKLAVRLRPWPHCVRWGPSSPAPKGQRPPIFGPYLLLPNGCMDQDATWYGGRPRPKQHCVRWDPAPPPKNGTEPPNFWPMSVVTKRLDELRCRRPWPWPHCARWGPSSPPQKGGTAPNFRPMFVVAKQLDGSRCHLV